MQSAIMDRHPLEREDAPITSTPRALRTRRSVHRYRLPPRECSSARPGAWRAAPARAFSRALAQPSLVPSQEQSPERACELEHCIDDDEECEVPCDPRSSAEGVKNATSSPKSPGPVMSVRMLTRDRTLGVLIWPANERAYVGQDDDHHEGRASETGRSDPNQRLFVPPCRPWCFRTAVQLSLHLFAHRDGRLMVRSRERLHRPLRRVPGRAFPPGAGRARGRAPCRSCRRSRASLGRRTGQLEIVAPRCIPTAMCPMPDHESSHERSA